MEFYSSSTLAWQVMCDACATARRSIDLEEYILRDDRIGSQLLDILAAKARAGLRVRVLLDAFGSRRIRHHPMMALLRDAGVQLIFYQPLSFVRILTLAWLPRDHAKALHIDDRQGFIGSMCVADHMLGWRDTLAAFDGRLASQARHDFDQTWSRAAGLPAPFAVGPGSDTNYSPIDTCVSQDSSLGIRAILASLLLRIGTAQRSIVLASPYFFPTRVFREALRAASQRGVVVTLILSSQTDMPVADAVTRALTTYWRGMGFDVMFYQTAVLHAKYGIIDEAWATVGSCNFDILSLRYNREVNLILQNPQAVAALVSQSRQDISQCIPMSACLHGQTIWHKAIGSMWALIYRVSSL